MLEPQVSKGSALTIRTKQMKALKNGRVQPRVELARTSDNGRADHTRFSRKNNRDNKDNMWCTYCKKLRQTKERCWKLNGKPPTSSKEWGYQGE